MKHYKTILLGFLALAFGSCGILKTMDGSWYGRTNSIPPQRTTDPTLQNGHTNWGHQDSVTVNCRIIRIKRRMLHTPLTKVRDV